MHPIKLTMLDDNGQEIAINLTVEVAKKMRDYLDQKLKEEGQ
ncbi:TPA: hypothetical protein ACSVZR_003546 [Bacillus cereus]